MYQINPGLVGNTLGAAISPVQSAFTKTAAFIKGRIDFIANMSKLSDENKLLSERIAELEIDNLKVEALLRENERLSNLLGTSELYPHLPNITADIISKEPGNWFHKFNINKGSRDGIRRNMIVLKSGALVGTVDMVGFNYSRVVSVIDDTSSVSARSERTGDIGFVRGDALLMLEGLCKMVNISREADIVIGDVIVTGTIAAGAEATIYPPGIAIGRVISVEPDVNGTQTAIIKPFVDLRHLSKVLVVTEVYGYDLGGGVDD
jgi:rod shape-determining protein MreC